MEISVAAGPDLVEFLPGFKLKKMVIRDQEFYCFDFIFKQN